MVPAMSIWAHFKVGSAPFLGSIPSAKGFKKRAAVQLPPGLPPYYNDMQSINSLIHQRPQKNRVMLTFWRSAFEEWIWGPYSSSRGIRQKRSCSATPAASRSFQSSSEVYISSLSIGLRKELEIEQERTEKTPVYISPRATSIALKFRWIFIMYSSVGGILTL